MTAYQCMSKLFHYEQVDFYLLISHVFAVSCSTFSAVPQLNIQGEQDYACFILYVMLMTQAVAAY